MMCAVNVPTKRIEEAAQTTGTATVRACLVAIVSTDYAASSPVSRHRDHHVSDQRFRQS
jgi:hypothetical protein